MSEIIDLTAERNQREQPDADCIRRDDFGRPMYLYLLEYKMNGSTWGMDVWAYDLDDANARVAAMKESLELLGQAFSMVPA